AGEILLPREVVLLRRRERTGGVDEEPGGRDGAVVTSDGPAVGLLVPHRRRDASVELEAAAQIEPIRDVVEIGQDFRMRGEALGPSPFPLQLFIERVGVVDAFEIASRSGVLIPVPHAAGALLCLETLHGESLHVSQPVGGIQAGKAGAHNYCINVSVGHAATMLCCDPSHIGLMTPMDTCRDTCFFRQTLLAGMAERHVLSKLRWLSDAAFVAAPVRLTNVLLEHFAVGAARQSIDE